MKVETYIRKPTEADLNFLYNSWLKSLRQSLSTVDNTIFYGNHKKLIEELVTKCRVVISCNPEDITQIFGYIVFEIIEDISILHYVYVKHPFRKLGIATELFKFIDHNSELPCVASHYTRIFETIGPKWGLVFNPYVLARGF